MPTAHDKADHWQVADTHVGNPCDAEARKGDQIVYLEAKGTQVDGDAVLVTAGEVRFARRHRGECFMGIVSGVRLDGAGAAVQGSGELHVVPWEPADDELEPVTSRWRPTQDTDG